MNQLGIHNINEFQDRLGRLHAPDDRDKNYLLRPRRASNLRKKFYPTGPILDQGSFPRCVEYAGVQYLRSGPILNKFNHVPGEVYHQCQLVDEWDGEDYDGTSVRALMKVFQQMGYVGEYRWAFDVGTVIDYVLTTGPVIVGTTWTMDMFNLRHDGFIRATGLAVGGHAYEIKGVNLDYPCPDGSVGAFRIVNSWGGGWGNGPHGGLAWISCNDMHNLILDFGEAVAATEILK